MSIMISLLEKMIFFLHIENECVIFICGYLLNAVFVLDKEKMKGRSSTMKRISEFKHLFFQKMQSGALILKVLKQSKSETDFEVISSNEYIYDFQQINEDIRENMLSDLARESELFSAIEVAVLKFYNDGTESHRYLYKDKSMLVKMNIFYIQKGIICLLIREKRNDDKNYDIASDELLEIYNACLANVEECVIISDYYEDNIILSNLGSMEDSRFSNIELKSKKINEIIFYDNDWKTLKEEINDNPEPNYPIYADGKFVNSDGLELPFLAKMKRIEINSKSLLLTIGLMK